MSRAAVKTSGVEPVAGVQRRRIDPARAASHAASFARNYGTGPPGRARRRLRVSQTIRYSAVRFSVGAPLWSPHVRPWEGNTRMRVLARVLLGLGVFLLVAGVLAVAWAPGVVKKTPLDVDTTTVYEGEAAKIDTADRRLRQEARLRHHAHQGRLEEVQRRPRAVRRDQLRGLRHRRRQGVRQRQRPRPDHCQHRHLRDQPHDGARGRGQEPPARRGPRRGADEQVPVRRGEEGLPVLGRHHRPGRGHRVRRHRDRLRARRPTGSPTR